MSDHTPAPWRVDTRSFAISATDKHGEYMHVADVRGWGRLTGRGQGGLALPDDEAVKVLSANAAFIVKACNAHEALVKALEEVSAIVSANVTAGRQSEGDDFNFTGKWRHLGRIRVGTVLDGANAALELAKSATLTAEHPSANGATVGGAK